MDPPDQVVRPSLVDLPMAWVDQLLAALGKEEIVTMFMTCTAMRDHVLERHPLRVIIALPIHPLEAAGMQAKLCSACKHSSNVCLVLSANPSQRPSNACTQRLLSGAMGELGDALTAITRVELMGLALDSVVPSWLTSACPNMRALKLTGCAHLAAADGSINSVAGPGCSHLKELELNYNVLQWPQWPAWQQQLCALSGLTSLTTSEPPGFLKECEALCTRLTQLSLTSVDDTGMEVLLSMPQLVRLECESFDLNQNYSQRACTWACLVVGNFDVGMMDRLPLEGISSIQISTPRIWPCNDLATCQRVAAAVVKYCNVKWSCNEDSLQGKVWVDNCYELADPTCVAALAPILAQHPFTQVELQRVRLDGSVPTWLWAACPHMRKLEFFHCRLDAPSAATTPLRELQELAIDSATLGSQRGWPAWQHELRAMPCLTSLTMSFSAFPFLAGCPELLTRLTQLDLLQKSVGFPEKAVHDDAMEVLLGMPRLTHLRCDSFGLQHDYTQRACRWQRLDLYRLHVDQLNRLPLDSIQAFQASTVISGTDLATCQKVATAIARCGGLPGKTICFGNTQAMADSACLAALMTVLSPSQYTRITFAHVHVTTEIVAAIRQALGRYRLEELHFTGCTWAPEVWPQLLPTLRPLPHLELSGVTADDLGLSEAALAQMCAHADHPVEVRIVLQRYQEGGQFQSGWEQRVEETMTAAGHHHVRLKVKYGSDAQQHGFDSDSYEEEESEEEHAPN